MLIRSGLQIPQASGWIDERASLQELDVVKRLARDGSAPSVVMRVAGAAIKVRFVSLWIIYDVGRASGQAANL